MLHLLFDNIKSQDVFQGVLEFLILLLALKPSHQILGHDLTSSIKLRELNLRE